VLALEKADVIIRAPRMKYPLVQGIRTNGPPIYEEEEAEDDEGLNSGAL
jgi:hypothetical protein